MRSTRIRNRSDTVAAAILKGETADCVQLYSERLCYPDSACTTSEGALQTMERNEHQYGKPNPSAPQELSQFAFLVANWRGEAKLKREDETWETLQALWEGRYILDGYAIADEYRMTTSAGELLVLGMNFRSYDTKKKVWNMKWLNALAGTWTDLGPEELGGVVADGKAISYRMEEPVARHAFTRATYTNISADHFTWRGDRSNDGRMWEHFLIIELYRSET
jgi:hypothetical protein